MNYILYDKIITKNAHSLKVFDDIMITNAGENTFIIYDIEKKKITSRVNFSAVESYLSNEIFRIDKNKFGFSIETKIGDRIALVYDSKTRNKDMIRPKDITFELVTMNKDMILFISERDKELLVTDLHGKILNEIFVEERFSYFSTFLTNNNEIYFITRENLILYYVPENGDKIKITEEIGEKLDHSFQLENYIVFLVYFGEEESNIILVNKSDHSITRLKYDKHVYEIYQLGNKLFTINIDKSDYIFDTDTLKIIGSILKNDNIMGYEIDNNYLAIFSYHNIKIINIYDTQNILLEIDLTEYSKDRIECFAYKNGKVYVCTKNEIYIFEIFKKKIFHERVQNIGFRFR